VRSVVASDLGLREADGTRCGVWIARGQTNLGAGQVARVAPWLASLKASGSLCLLDGRKKDKMAEA